MFCIFLYMHIILNLIRRNLKVLFQVAINYHCLKLLFEKIIPKTLKFKEKIFNFLCKSV